MRKRIFSVLVCLCLLLLLLPAPVHADSVTDTIGIYVGYFGWQEDEYKEKATYHWTELDDWVGGALDTRETIYSYYSGSRTYLVAARGFSIRDLLYYAGIDVWSIASIDFFTQDHANGAYRSFSRYSLLDLPRYYFPNLAANEETREIYPWDGDDIWNGATTVEAMLALEDYTEWDTVGSEFEKRYDPALLSPNCRFHLFFGQADPTEASTSSAAKYCYKILITFSGTPVLSTEETDMTLKIGSGRKLEIDIDAEDSLLTDYVREHLTFSSSDEGVVTVDENGVLSVLGAGEAIVAAAFGQSSVSVHITVGEEEVEGGIGGDAPGGIGGETAGQTLPVTTVPETPAEPPAVATEEPTPEPTLAPETGTVLDPPPPSEPSPPPEATSGKRIYQISPAAISAMAGAKSSPDAKSESGVMEPGSTQLTLTELPERINSIWIPAAAALALGAIYEIIRFRRMLKR